MQRRWMLVHVGWFLLLTGCGGDDGPDTNGNGGSPDPTQNEVACATSGTDGVLDGVPTDLLSRFSVPGVMWYQNGFVATEVVIDNVAISENRTVPITTDRANRQISNPDPFGNRLPGLIYDTEGQITSVDSLTGTSIPVAVSYNDDGTISQLLDDRGDSSEEVRFTYENGLLTQRTRVGNFNGQPEPVVSAICYRYDASARVVEAIHQDPVTGAALPMAFDRFSIDESGNISEITEGVASDGSFTARHVLAYDSAGNITSHETYAPDGALQRVASMTYEASSDPAPNLFGLLSFINPDFVPRYESTLP